MTRLFAARKLLRPTKPDLIAISAACAMIKAGVGAPGYKCEPYMIVVFGSINIDLVTRAERIPGPGETVLGGDYVTVPGGKGANQALAARRAGAKVALVGAYGDDGFAKTALSLLAADGVDLAFSRARDKPTGAAFITVDPHGENAIVVAAGANALASAEQLKILPFGAGDTLLLQREVPIPEVEAAAALAKKRGAKVALNAAPAGAVSPALLATLDFLVVNEHEVEIVGAALGIAGEVEAIAQDIERRHGIATLVTLGAAGAVGFFERREYRAPAPKVTVVDTTAAGDSFVGAFAAALDCGRDFAAALKRGLAAGSLACTKPGAQPSMPYADEIERLAGS
jgi:ribokinase